MTLKWVSRAFVAGMFASTSIAAHAATLEQPRYEPAPGWVEARQLDPVGEGDRTVLLLVDSQIRVEDDRSVEYRDLAYQVVSPEMLSRLGNVKVEWQPDVQDALIHAVSIVRGGETIDALNGGKSVEVIRREADLEKQSLDGKLTATMQLTGLQLGDVVRVTYSVVSSDPALGGNAEGLESLPVAPIQVGQYHFRLLWPEAKALRWTADTELSEESNGSVRQIRFDGVLPKLKDQPENAPARFVQPPKVNYTTFPDWQSVSLSVAPLYNDHAKLAPGGPLSQRAAAIAAAHDNQLDRMAAAVELVQDEVRYLYEGMEFGNYTPQDPAVTWEKRYGDCKAKSLMLLGLLRELGIEADAMLVRAEDGDIVGELLPGLYAFNHVVVRAKVDGTDYWLDGTMQGSTRANIADVANFAKALPLNEAGSDLIDVPVRPMSEPTQVLERELDLRAGVGFPGIDSITMRFRGPTATQLLAAQSSLDKKSFDDVLDGILSSAGNDGAVFERSLHFENDGQTAIVSGKALESYYWQWEDRRYQTQLNPPVENFTFDADRGRAAWSHIPVMVNHPLYQATTVRLLLPEMAEPFELRGAAKFDSRIGGIQFHHDYELAGQILTGDMMYRSVASEIAASELPDVRTRIAKAKADKLRLLVPASLTSKTLAIRQNVKSPAVKRLRDAYAAAIAQADADDLQAYRNRASFLTGIGEHAGAAHDLAKVLQQEPSVADYIWHAQLTEVDDPEAALRSIAKARELEPASANVMNGLAKVLWLNNRPDEILLAADEFESLGVEKTDVDMVRATAMALAGREEEAVALLDAAFEEKPGNAALYRARCSLKAQYGLQLESALKDCTRATELSENSSSALEDRGLAYWRMDRKEAAIEDWRSALLTNPDAPHARWLLGLAQGGRAGAQMQREAILMDEELPLELKNWGIAD